MAPKGYKVMEMDTPQRKATFLALLTLDQRGDVKPNIFVSVERTTGINRGRLKRLWRAVLENMAGFLIEERGYADDTEGSDVLQWFNDNSINVGDFPMKVYQSNKIGTVGRKKKWDRELLKERTRLVPYNQRGTYRNHAHAIGVPLTTVWKLLKKEKIFVINSNDVKPNLTNKNKEDRVQHCITHIDLDAAPENYQYVGMFDQVHVDEKWFYLTKVNRRYILVSDEELPKRSVQHKNHITKVMFLCAQARPRKVRGRMWDGKIGIWPVGRWKMAQRTTGDQSAGDFIWENETLDAEKYFDLLIREVVPAIIKKWPLLQWNDDNFTIKIQQDGAKPHTTSALLEDFELRMQELWIEGKLPCQFKILLYTQPANSPDLNILDLGFFCALQALYYQEAPRNSRELIEMVKNAYALYPPTKINRVWLTLQCCMNQILGVRGCHHYKIPHMNKAKLEREDKLPRVIDCRSDIISIIKEFDDPEVVYTEAELERDIRFYGKVSAAEIRELREQSSMPLTVSREDLAGEEELDDGDLEADGWSVDESDSGSETEGDED